MPVKKAKTTNKNDLTKLENDSISKPRTKKEMSESVKQKTSSARFETTKHKTNSRTKSEPPDEEQQNTSISARKLRDKKNIDSIKQEKNVLSKKRKKEAEEEPEAPKRKLVTRAKSVPPKEKEKKSVEKKSKDTENVEDLDLSKKDKRALPGRSRKDAEKQSESPKCKVLRAKSIPPKKQTKTTSSSKTSKASESKKEKPEKKRVWKEDSDENDEFLKKRPTKQKSTGKKRKIVIPEDNSDDSEDDYKPDSDASAESETDYMPAPSLSESEPLTDSEDEKIKKKKAKTKEGKAKSQKTSKRPVKSLPPSHEDQKQILQKVSSSQSWPHLKYDFLQSKKIMDKKMHRLDHPDYDPKTLFVPKEFMNKLTPSMRQWWEFKSDHFDCIVFYKLGKFYHLNHMDAVIAVNELNLTFMKLPIMSEYYAFTGIPEMHYGRHSSILIERGYKIARIEQTETMEDMNDRVYKMTNATKFDKIVKRELCQISSKGIRIYTAQDINDPDPTSIYLLSIIEKQIPRQNESIFGVCFTDTTIGDFYLGQFQDDRCNSRLLTLIAHYPPTHVIYERGNLSQLTMQLINKLLPGVPKEALLKDSQFWSATKVIEHLHEEEYFKNKSDSTFSWPKELELCLDQDKSSQPIPKAGKELAIKALGGVVSILQEYMLDYHVLSLRQFKTYIPAEFVNSVKPINKTKFAQNMVLDSMTINNLKILGNNGSLIKTIDHSCTAFGKRLLREWICRPSCRKNVIIERQEAIAELLDNIDIVHKIRKKLSGLADIQRLLSKIHAQGNTTRFQDHPDSRAIMFNHETYSMRMVYDFVAVLNGLSDILDIIELLDGFHNSLIKKISKIEPEGSFPDMKDALNHFKNGFNQEDALREGYMLPEPGIDKDYDKIMATLVGIEKELDEYLEKQKEYFGTEVKFYGRDYKRFQVEVPESHTHKAKDGYEIQGSRKGFKRYYTNKAKDLLWRLVAAEKDKSKTLSELNRRIVAKFCESYEKWSKAIYNVAVLDCLISFVQYSRSCDTCVPIIYDDLDKEEILIEIRDGKHPCLKLENFTPNDTLIGTKDSAPLMLLTGPNMGGKSTLMRQVGLITVMAQMGCYVPASECRLTLTDRIFTRLGANDDIMAGQSTFLVELSETATILQSATKYSLVLLDELGRGTSTYDGTAIAASVVEALTKMKCRALFSTHYHSLVEDYKSNKNVIITHMACKVETDQDDANEENVTFLYKLKKGVCPKSYGFNVAKLAGIPAKIIKHAQDIATKLEAEVNLRHAFTNLCRTKDRLILKSLIKKSSNFLNKY